MKEALSSTDSSARLRVGAMNQATKTPGITDVTFRRLTEPGSGQAGHHTNHLFLCTQLCRSWPSPLASPSSIVAGTTNPGPSWPQTSRPLSSHSGGGEQTPDNMKSTCANKAPESGRPVPLCGPSLTLTLKCTRDSVAAQRQVCTAVCEPG